MELSIKNRDLIYAMGQDTTLFVKEYVLFKWFWSMCKLLSFTVVNQFYKAEILTEYVIRGNTAVLKCSIPSFVADFVHVEAWIDDQGNTMIVSNNYGNFPRNEN